MRRLSLWFVLLLAAGIMVAPGISLATPIPTDTVQLVVSDSFIQVGDTFSVTVSVFHSDSSDTLTSFGFDVDPGGVLSNIVLTGVTLGSGYDDYTSHDNYVSAFRGTDSSTWQIDTTILLATLSFEAVGVGTDTLTISGLNDGVSYGLYYWTSDSELLDLDIAGATTITVHSGAGAVPIPAPLLLLGTGLIGIGVCKRKAWIEDTGRC